MSASVQVAALFLGLIEMVLRVAVLVVLVISLVGVLLLMLDDEDGQVHVLLTPYLWRKAMP